MVQVKPLFALLFEETLSLLEILLHLAAFGNKSFYNLHPHLHKPIILLSLKIVLHNAMEYRRIHPLDLHLHHFGSRFSQQLHGLLRPPHAMESVPKSPLHLYLHPFGSRFSQQLHDLLRPPHAMEHRRPYPLHLHLHDSQLVLQLL